MWIHVTRQCDGRILLVNLDHVSQICPTTTPEGSRLTYPDRVNLDVNEPFRLIAELIFPADILGKDSAEGMVSAPTGDADTVFEDANDTDEVPEDWQHGTPPLGPN